MEFFISPLALLITLVGVYIFFKLNALKELIVGQGAAIISNYDDPVFRDDFKEIFTARQIRRLRDAVLRKNIYGIEEGIINGTINELKQPTKSENGFYFHVLPMFIKTKKTYNYLIRLSLVTLSVLFSSTLLMLTNLVNIYYSENQSLSAFEIILLVIISLAFVLTIYLIAYTIIKKVAFERNKTCECKKLRAENPEIDKLYYCP